jgi:hypothetical protein
MQAAQGAEHAKMSISPPNPEPTAPGRERCLTWGAAALCIALIFWMGLGWDVVVSRESYAGKKIDYYSSQVHGFLSGHLYLDKEAYAGWESPDPETRAKAPFLLDASYYRGRYYLYFGVTPAALFLLPYAWLSGGDLDPRFLIVLGVAAGFLFSVAILRMTERDNLSRFPPSFRCSSVAILAFASAVPFLLTWAKFYEVAVATGFAFTMAGVFWTYRALSGRGRPSLQLGLASASLGLAVGCRPDLVLNVPVVAAAAVLVVLREWKKGSISGLLLRNGVAAVAPAALVGLLLGIYNYERFGSPFEFGVTYSMNSFMRSGKPLFSAAYLWPNIHWYYLTFPAISPYFPYVFPEGAEFGPPFYRGGEAIHGQFPVFILVTFVAASAFLFRKRLRLGPIATLLGIVTWMFLAVLLAIAAIGFRGDRYMVDFQAPLVLGTVLLASAVVGALGGLRGTLWRTGFAVLGALAAGFNVFAGLQEFNAFKNLRPGTFHALESLGNHPAFWLVRLGVFSEGPVELRVIFPTDLKSSAVEPLLVAGTPGSTDALYVVEDASGRQIEFLGDHSGYGGPRSEPIGIIPGKTYTLSIDMGALYPPRGPPFTAGFKVSQGRQIKTRILVGMDGKSVLERIMNSYDAPPWALQVGKNRITMSEFKTEFSGRIVSAKRLPPPFAAETRNDGLWRIRCTFPERRANMNFPLLSAGEEGSGTMVYLNVLPGNRVRFGLDEWGYGGGLSPELATGPASSHEVELLIGPLAASSLRRKESGVLPHKLGDVEHALVVWLDGIPVWRTDLRHAVDSSDSMFEVGGNSQGFTTAEAEYPDAIKSVPYSPGEAHAFLVRNLGIDP